MEDFLTIILSEYLLDISNAVISECKDPEENNVEENVEEVDTTDVIDDIPVEESNDPISFTPSDTADLPEDKMNETQNEEYDQ